MPGYIAENKSGPCLHETHSLEERQTVNQWSHERVKIAHGEKGANEEEKRALLTAGSTETSLRKKDEKELTRIR